MAARVGWGGGGGVGAGLLGVLLGLWGGGGGGAGGGGGGGGGGEPAGLEPHAGCEERDAVAGLLCLMMFMYLYMDMY